LPLALFSQSNNVFIKLTDARGQQIKGETVLKGYESWVQGYLG